jgi:hypothetical protein
MNEALKLLEEMTVSQPQLLVSYCKISLNPPIVDGMITSVPSSVNTVDHVVNMVTSLIEPVDKVVNPIPYLVDPTLPLENVNKVVDPIPFSVNPTLSLESETQEVDPFPPVDSILPLENEAQVVF